MAFFDRVRLNGTNAFVINVLACDSVTGRLEHEAASAGQHVGGTAVTLHLLGGCCRFRHGHMAVDPLCAAACS